MKEVIREHFEENLERVEALLQFYAEIRGDGGGRRPVAATDLLRSAVVFLHATLEDLLRSALRWKWPSASRDLLVPLTLPGLKEEAKFSLSQLAVHRGKTVDDVVVESVVANLEKSNFNHPDEIREALERIGVATTVLGAYRARLQAMMRRRHLIVHRADRNETHGRGQHSTLSLSSGMVEKWRDAVRDFGRAVLQAL